MNQPANDDHASGDVMESLVAEAVDSFMEAAERGEQPDIEQYALRYPRIADVLRRILPALGVIRQGKLPPAPPDTSKAFPEVDGCLGDYRIMREIGRGGMGIVYEAEQISLRRRVALKVLPFAAALDPKRLERFKNEAQAAARLHHSNIVPVHAVGCERGVYYYAMQMIEGESLADVIEQLRQLAPSGRRNAEPADLRGTGGESLTPPEPSGLDDTLDVAVGPLDHVSPKSRGSNSTVHAQAAISTVQSTNRSAFFHAVAELGIQAAEALEYAHSQDIVHRDIKPANLLVDSRGNLWVTDFGLARLISDAGLTVTGDVLGTFRYMSPEQANGHKAIVDHRADIYSLGATLYELLTLEPVFDGSSREELLRQITSHDPIAPRRRNRAIPTDLETIILKSITKEPQGRYGTARGLADDLRRFLDSRPIRAKRPTLVELASKWSRRHKPMVVSGVVVLLLAVLGLTISNVLIAREQRKTEAAYLELDENHRLLEHEKAKADAAHKKLAEKQEATAAALVAEARERERAESNFQQARRMVEFFLEVSEEDLANRPDVQDVRGKLLQAALQYYQTFIEQSGDDPPLQAELARSHLHVARILYEIGSTPGAQAALEQALRTQEALVRDHPEDRELREGLVGMYYHFGIMRSGLQLWLVSQVPIQEHLALTDEQVEAIETIEDQHDQLLRKFRDSQSLDFQKYREHTVGLQQAITQVLDGNQSKRFDQLVLQKIKTHAFSDPQIASILQLTMAQKLKIRTIQDEATGCNHQRIFDVLTPDQMATWSQLVGEPFPWETVQSESGRPRGKRRGK